MRRRHRHRRYADIVFLDINTLDELFLALDDARDFIYQSLEAWYGYADTLMKADPKDLGSDAENIADTSELLIEEFDKLLDKLDKQTPES